MSCCDIWAKFDRANGEILSTSHWSVVIRRKQVTLGALVLICREHVGSVGGLSREAAADLPVAAKALETTLHVAFQPEKLNYLALMMVDPHLHFHVLPRYSKPRDLHGYTFTDAAWDGPPRLDVETPPGEVVDAVLADLRSARS